jgi:hypothetical protein
MVVISSLFLWSMLVYNASLQKLQTGMKGRGRILTADDTDVRRWESDGRSARANFQAIIDPLFFAYYAGGEIGYNGGVRPSSGAAT